jgi:DASH complex subunit DAD1
VGNEFSSVEALWSQFENVMAKDESVANEADNAGAGGEQDETVVQEQETRSRRHNSGK